MKHTGIIATGITAKWRDSYALNDVSFELNAGDHLLISGASGSGKTMLAKALAGKLFHQGDMRFIQNERHVQPRVVLVEQHYHFRNLSNTSLFYYQQRFNSFDADDASTVWEELKNTCKEYFNPAQATALIKDFGLEHAIHSPMTYLSSGEHKRFQIIRALLLQPGVIILDEPFTGLDKKSRLLLKQALNDLSANGTTCVIICKLFDTPACISHVVELSSGALKSFVRIEEQQEEVAPASIASVAPVSAPLAVDHFCNAIVFKNVSVSYGERAILKNINWTVRKSDRWLLKGHNGAGKSSLLSLITGDNPQAYANEIYLFDKRRGSGESIWDIKKKIGYVSPELQWYFDANTSCFDTVASGLFDTIGLFRKICEKQAQQVDKWLLYFGLEANANQLLSALPAGKQRLCLLARAMVKNPPLLILDEPCQGLDEQQKWQFIQIVEALCDHPERTLIYVSHYAEDVPACIKEVLELKNGEEHIYSLSHHIQNPLMESHTV